MIEKLKSTAAVLLSIAVVDGVVNLIEWFGGFDLFKAAGTVGLVLLVAAMILNRETTLGRLASGLFVVVGAKVSAFCDAVCKAAFAPTCCHEDDALAGVIVAEADARSEETTCS